MRKTEASAEMESGTVLGKAVFRASQALGLTGAELATVIGVSPASISRLNDGNYTLRGKPFELAACLVRVFRFARCHRSRGRQINEGLDDQPEHTP